MSDSLDDARVRILVENTAQAVFKHLERLEDVRDRLGARWVWELLQNARDVATSEGVAVDIALSEDELLFRHDGRPFTEDELAHLIYHGSTKVTKDDSDLIHFGSGFLSTHLLSRHVTVRGRLVRGERAQAFSFVLNRSGDSVEELNDSMQRTWREFLDSLDSDPSAQIDSGTSFSYALNGAGKELAMTGLGQLKSYVDLSLAFSPEIRSVSVRTTAESWEVHRGEKTHRDGVIVERFDAKLKDDSSARYVALAGDDFVQAALPLRSVDKKFVIDLPAGTPRLFVVFPLLTTDRLALPTIVQSKEFAPLEDRDGLPLEGDSVRSVSNRQIMERSVGFARRLIERAAAEEWRGAETLFAFNTDSLPDWAPQQWVRTQLRAHLEYVRAVRLLLTSVGTRIAPQDAMIPLGTSDETRDEIWELTTQRTDARSRLPDREHLQMWANNLSAWHSLVLDEFTLPETLGVKDLASFAAERRSVDVLSKDLEHLDSLGWLVRICQLVLAEGASDLFDSLAFLPSQAGHLHKRSELELDGGIDPVLKTVSDELGVQLRDRLIAPGVAEGALADLFAPLTETAAVDEIISHHATLGRDGVLPTEHLAASSALFRWLARSGEHRDRLDGFQVASAEGTDAGFALLQLERHAHPPPLAPSVVWGEAARQYEELFPRRRILHNVLADADGELDWAWLSQSGFVALDPIIRRKRRLSVFVSSSGVIESEEDDDAHQSVDAIEMSDIAFLEEQDLGLIDSARRSMTRALELMRFVLLYAASEDSTAFEELSQECECGESHPAFRAGWLVPLRRRKWIPARDGSRRSLNVNAEVLADLVRGTPDIVDQLATDVGDRLLRAWGISPSDFQLRVVAEDETTRKTLVLAVGDLARASGSLERFQALAQEISDHPELISQIELQREQREKVERNARIGELVETLLQSELSAEGFTVTRTGVGSDFEIETDFISDEPEILIEIAKPGLLTLIEVKSTRTDYVRMTPRQAESATTNIDGFCLCVVELMDDDPTAEAVRAGSWFVFDIGDLLGPAWSDYARYAAATSDVRRRRGEIDVVIEEGQVRFRVEQNVWRRALDFTAAVERFRGA